MMQPPILIAGPPRSGTTMVAGLLYHHGVWVGRARETTYPGTNPKGFGSENQDIKELLKDEAERIGYRNWCVPIPDEVVLREDLKELIDAIAPQKGPWLLKTSWTLVFHRFFIEAYPDAKWILMWRPREMILDSMRRHPRMARRPVNMKINFVKALHRRQQEVIRMLSENDFITLDVDKISQRDLVETERLFKYIDIPVNWEMVNKWIQPDQYKRA